MVPVGECGQNAHYFVQNATFIFREFWILSRPQLIKILHQRIHILQNPHISAHLKEGYLCCAVLQALFILESVYYLSQRFSKAEADKLEVLVCGVFFDFDLDLWQVDFYLFFDYFILLPRHFFLLLLLLSFLIPLKREQTLRHKIHHPHHQLKHLPLHIHHLPHILLHKFPYHRV